MKRADDATLARAEARALLALLVSSALGLTYALEQPLLLLPGVVALVLARPLRRRGLRLRPTVEGGILLATLLLALPLGLVFDQVPAALGLFLLTAQALKTVAPRSARDQGTACLVGLALTGVVASEAVDPPVLLLLLANLACAAAFAALHDLRRHGQGVGTETVRWHGAPWGRRQVAPLLRLSVLAILLAVAFFLLFPRVGAKFFANHRGSRTRLAGFSDRVGLADIGRIKLDDRVAFRVECSAAPFAEQPYWRGRALDRYAAGTWGTSRYLRLTRRILHRSSRTRFEDPIVRPPAPGQEPLRVTFYVEPLGARCLFALGNPRAVLFKQSAPHNSVQRDDLGALLLLDTSRAPFAYTLETYLHDDPSRSLLGIPRQRIVRRLCSKLPPDVDAERLRRYARTVLREARVAESAPPSRKAAVLARRLRRDCAYSLEIDAPPGAEPIEEFLFRRRKGHCELFASAHALLLRSIGIPARLVTGFRGGEYSSWSGTYTVRQRDAHAWVEAYTERGWLPFDPTPAAEDPPTAGALLAAGRELLDWLELRWYSAVISYDAYDQRGALASLEERVWLPLRARLSEDKSRWAAVATLCLSAAFCGALLLRRRRHAPGTSLRAPDRDLRALFAALAARGIARSPGETPRELARRAARELGLDGRLERWVEGYYARRWGGRPAAGGCLPPLQADLPVDARRASP